MTTPVLLIIYNRPKVTKKQLYSLSKINLKNFYVFCDGPSNVNEEKLVLETRELINNLTWKTNLKTNFQEKNLGCKNGVETALDWFFDNVEFGIILEDDCIPNKDFFKFTSDLLTRYKDDNRISIITGFNAGISLKNYSYSYYFSMYGGVWGWASWSNRWKEYRNQDIKKLFNNKELISSLIKKGISKTYLKYVGLTMSGKLDTWDYLWSFYNMSQNRLSIIPQKNLIRNIGFGHNATHTKIASNLTKIKHENIKNKISHPNFIFPSYLIDNTRKLSHNKLYQLIKIFRSIFK